MDPKLAARLVPVATFLLLALVLLGGWLLFPRFEHMMKHQDCVGSGATNC